MSVQVVMPMAVMEETAELTAPVSTPPCTAMSKSAHAGTADAVIVELLTMSYMSVQVVMPMAVMEETAALTAPVSTPSCTAMSKSAHAGTADAVIAELLTMSYMSVQVVMPMAVMEETAALTAPVSTPPCTAMSKSAHAGTADAEIAELLMMCYMSVQVLMPMAVMEETAALAAPV